MGKFLWTGLLGFLAAAMAVWSAQAQTASLPPYVYGKTLGTTATAILLQNASRKRVIFHNPNPSIFVAVCPDAPDRSSGATFTATINGAGCITIVPLGEFVVDAGQSPGPVLTVSVGWRGIASAPGAALTILEFQ